MSGGYRRKKYPMTDEYRKKTPMSEDTEINGGKRKMSKKMSKNKKSKRI